VKSLILTSLSGYGRALLDLADVVIPFTSRPVWGPLPSADEFAAYVGARPDNAASGSHWSDFVGRWPKAEKVRKHLALVEFCEPFEVIELWFDPQPVDQLLLVQLLDFFCRHPSIVAKLRVRLVDFDFLSIPPKGLGKWRVLAVDVTDAEFRTARAAWQAYRDVTPEACFNLLRQDLSPLPLLRPVLLDLLDELPSSMTGLGATEMRLLELIASGYSGTNGLFHLRGLRQRRVFNQWETGSLLDGLAYGPRPAIAGLDEELRTLAEGNYRDRDAAYKRSRLTLTEFGKSVLGYKEDFSRHNPIDRWWGGTKLTNDNLWRWGPELTVPSKRG
jgi:hypothetical protein